MKCELIRANEFIKLNCVCSVVEKHDNKCVEFKNVR